MRTCCLTWSDSRDLLTNEMPESLPCMHRRLTRSDKFFRNDIGYDFEMFVVLHAPCLTRSASGVTQYVNIRCTAQVSDLVGRKGRLRNEHSSRVRERMRRTWSERNASRNRRRWNKPFHKQTTSRTLVRTSLNSSSRDYQNGKAQTLFTGNRDRYRG